LSTRPPGRESGSIGGNGDGDDETAAWTRLAQDLGLSDADLETLVQRWPRLGQSMGRPDDALSSDSAFLPHRVDQLGWIGLSPAGLAALTPHVTLLPTPTPINLNTAGADVLQAVIPGLDAAAARQLLVLRARRPWQSLEEARQALGPLGHQIQPSRHAVTSRYFLIRTRLQRGSLVRQSEALVERGSNSGIQVIWRRTLPSMAAGQGTDGG